MCFALAQPKTVENPEVADFCWLVSIDGTVNVYDGASVDPEKPFIGGVYRPKAEKRLQSCEDWEKENRYLYPDGETTTSSSVVAGEMTSGSPSFPIPTVSLALTIHIILLAKASSGEDVPVLLGKLVENFGIGRGY